MEAFLNYIVEAGLSLGIFTFFYWFFLRTETRFGASRIYLLVALVFSTILPTLTIRVGFSTETVVPGSMGEAATLQTNLLEAVTVYAAGIPAKMSKVLLSFTYSQLVFYIGGSIVLLLMLSGLYQLYRNVSKNRAYRLNKARLVVSEKEMASYSFFSYIFISKKLVEETHWKSIVYHELVHARQGHTFDVLFVDFMMIFQWFNPFYWLIRQMVRENHEYLADSEVLKKEKISFGHYKALLLSQAIGGKPIITSNFFNIKTVKKRFKMITKNKIRKTSPFKYGLFVTIALALTLVFACEKHDLVREGGNSIVYMGRILGESESQELGLTNTNTILVEKSIILEEFPELKGEDISSEVDLIINLNDIRQIKLMNRINSIQVFEDGEKDDDVFVIVEEMPEFPGGKEAFIKYLAMNVTYPQLAKEEGVEGKVYVTFVVGTDGRVEEPFIARGIPRSQDDASLVVVANKTQGVSKDQRLEAIEDMEAEALRVIAGSPQWQAGKQRGEPVRVRYTIPINFQLQ